MNSGDGMTCPNICPTSGGNFNEKGEANSNKKKDSVKSQCTPYVPGCIRPPTPKVYPSNAPPRYLPQPTDTTSGDFLKMGSIDPWAAGHLDWTPQSGTTGVRPVVDKYSITKYSTGDWRKNNERILTSTAVNKAKQFEAESKNDKANVFNKLNGILENSNKELDQRINDLNHWKIEVEKALKAITDEIETLDENRARLKGACRILMLPEAISRECLELRTQRYEPDLVRDDAEQELIREVAIVGEIRRVFMNTLAKVEEQMVMNRAAKAAIECDWNDKLISLALDKVNRNLTPDSNLLLYHPGVARWPENASSLEYWKHYCAESIRNCEEVRKKSENLRGDLMTAIIKGSEDMKLQAERTNAALADTVNLTEQMCDKLEETLQENLRSVADIENLIDDLKESIRQIDERNKLVMTRLHARNYSRPNVENCRDDAQYALMAEAKFVKESSQSFHDKLREAEAVRSDLMKYRGDLEKEIACKRKSLSIDKDRCSRIRAHMPSPEEFAAAAFMVAGAAVYPAGWNEPAVQETCGPAADQYNIGRCHVRWAYLLAVIGCLDGIVLAALAFILATRHVKLQPDTAYPPPSLYKGEVNNAYVTDAQSVAGSRKSLALQPVLLVRPPPDIDSYSHYSHPSHHSGRTPRPKHGLYANAMHNYQL